ncbi:MAG: biotin transporter BioY [Nitriliruptorales bacterium]|nr:biotin transporter BioY [Nitriliruptorales bacterium]
MHSTTLAEALWAQPDARTHQIVRAIVLMLGGSLALALSAQFEIPWQPVPFTMQTFVVLVLGIVYGRDLGAATGALYLGMGAVGLPVFAGGASRAALTGATAGYLVGFVVAMAVVGYLARRGLDRNVFGVLGVMLVGEVIIFGLGLAWLAQVIGSWDAAVANGLEPFLVTESLKVALAVATVPLAWKAVDRLDG